MTPEREAALLKAPVTRERERVASLPHTPNLPTLEFEEPKYIKPKSDEIWRLAEKLLEFAAQQGGYTVRAQVRCGKRFGSHVVVDMLCSLPGKKDEIIVSCKWQREGGSFDGKVCDEVTRLEELLPRGDIIRAYVVLVGSGIQKSKRQRWVAGEINTTHVRVVDLDFFLAKAYCQAL